MIVPALILRYHLYQMTFTKQLILRLEMAVTLAGHPASEIATADLSGDVEPWNFDANPASSPPKFPRDDWELPGPDTPLSSLSSLLIKLIDPELQDGFSFSKSSLLGTTDLVKGAYRSISTTHRKHMEGIVIELFSSD